MRRRVKPTHWKQTVFYLEDTVTMCQVSSGSVLCHACWCHATYPHITSHNIDESIDRCVLAHTHTHGIMMMGDGDAKCRTALMLPAQRTLSAVWCRAGARARAQGEHLMGHLICKPNAKNPRDLDIAIEYNFEGKRGEAAAKQQYRMR